MANTRYEVGDTVQHEDYDGLFEVIEIHNAGTDSPDYFIEATFGQAYGDDVREVANASELEKYDPNASLPEGWTSGLGEGGDDHYTRWFYHDEKGLEAEWYWDKGNDHTILIREKDGEYPEMTRKFDTEEEADENLNDILREASRKLG